VRKKSGFRILIEDKAGNEQVLLVDSVIDASGTYGNHRWFGAGGIPAGIFYINVTLTGISGRAIT
jgi:hypothetical protein